MNVIISHWPSLALLCLSAIPAAYMHAHDHGKLKDNGKPTSFFGVEQWKRKYLRHGQYLTMVYAKEFPAFWGSTTIFVMVTDAYHASQALMRILMSLSVTLAIGAPWWAFLVIWLSYATIHALFYKLLSR